MRTIKLLCKHIEDELCDAHTYAELALEYKDNDRETAELFSRLSSEEMNHMEMLHKDVARLIEEHRKQHGEPPANMIAVYDYLHRKQIEKAEKVGVLQAMFKNNT